jgi:NDP-sugar pyrophosphorylase family protein
VIEYNKFEPRLEMQYIDYGLGILSGVVFDEQVGEEAFDLATLYMALSKRGELAGFKVCQRFYEIGSPEGLAETEQYFKLMCSA